MNSFPLAARPPTLCSRTTAASRTAAVINVRLMTDALPSEPSKLENLNCGLSRVALRDSRLLLLAGRRRQRAISMKVADRKTPQSKRLNGARQWAIGFLAAAAVASRRFTPALVLLAAMTPSGFCLAGDNGEVSHGQYLTQLGGCASCHTATGGAPFAGAFMMKLPIGTLYTPNITPDRETGIGAWSDDDFVRAMQQGVSRDGRRLYPAFPYTSYTLMSRTDILAIKAYLFSLLPVHNVPPPSHLSFPYNMRSLMRGWNFFFLADKRFQDDPHQTAQWNRGAYLVRSVGHCGECHTPRAGVSQSMETGKFLTGGVADGWSAYNITSDPIAGIGAWSEDDLKQYLLTGSAPGKAWAAGPMGLEVANSTRHLTDDDVVSVVTYLRTVPAGHGSDTLQRSATTEAPRSLSASALDRMAGARIYALYCANCHGSSALPVTNLYPSMANESTVGDAPPRNLVMMILQGARNSFSSDGASMPSFAGKFNDGQIADLVNYLQAQYGNPKSSVTPKQVGAWRAEAP
jgi:mono/diheme cytochrome c family protein